MIDTIKRLVKDMYSTRNQLRNIDSRWDFTLDGKLVGDIGEVLACYHFDLTPLRKGAKTHDAKTKEGKMVQIKTTQKDIVGLGLERRNFEYLIVVKIFENGTYDFIYSGPGNKVWDGIGFKSLEVSIKKLKILNDGLDENERIVMKNHIV